MIWHESCRMIYNSDTMWYTMQTILFLRITLWLTKARIKKVWEILNDKVLCVWKRIVASDSLVPEDSEYCTPEMSYCGLIIKMQEIILCKSVWCGLGNTVCRIHFKVYAAIFRFERILHLNGFRTLANIDDLPWSSCLPNCALVQSYFGLCFFTKPYNLILILRLNNLVDN